MLRAHKPLPGRNGTKPPQPLVRQRSRGPVVRLPREPERARRSIGGGRGGVLDPVSLCAFRHWATVG